MANPVEVKIIGLDQIQKALEDQIPKKAKAALRSGLRAGAKVLQDAIVREAPKDTGLLAEHIDIKTRVRGALSLTGSAFVGPNSKAAYPEFHRTHRFGKKGDWHAPAWWVARLQETGRKGMPANPFMTRAFEMTKRLAVDVVIEKLKAILSR